jgi:hypothetical protein
MKTVPRQKCTLTKMPVLINLKLVIKYSFQTISIQQKTQIDLNWKGPVKIIDIKDTNSKIKINNKVKVLNIERLKLFLEENFSERDTILQALNFNDAPIDGPLTCLSKIY